ncbi:hypothetical protein ACJMK2_029375 [Sinanodonta woodiana]|uniref:RING-type domain-containing protein n=1 Tax=Sinanodonta woodiana TaxID=1069815 RepID=A0ABD3X9Z9_SINWO
MATLTDRNIVTLLLQDAKKNYRMEICRENFEMIKNGVIVIDKLFETIYYFPESFSKYEVQAHIAKNSHMIFPSFHKCLYSLKQMRPNVVFVDNKHTYATDKTDSLIQILQDLSNEYGNIFKLEYDAAKKCLKDKIKSNIGVNYNGLKHKQKNVIIPPRKMEGGLNNTTCGTKVEEPLEILSNPIFRTNNRHPPSLFSNCRTVIGEIVPDCAGQDSIYVHSTPQSQPFHQTRNIISDVHNTTLSNSNPTHIERLEQASGSAVILPSVNDTQEQNGNQQRSPKYPRYRTYDARIASYATFREFTNLNTEEMARTGLFYTGKADEVQCFQCGIEHTNWRPDKDPLLEHIKQSPDCQFLETLLGVSTLNEYKRQIRSGQMISGRELFSRSATNGGATGGSFDPVFTDSDHIRSPQYLAYRVRLCTFTKWPSSMTQKPEEVAQAGFYYTGLNDVVRCFACDGGLKNWDPGDEPWIEHARWFPQCPFVQKVKGQDFIELVRRMTNELDEEEEVEEVVANSTFQRNNVLVNQSSSQHLSVGNDIDEPSQLDTDAAQAVIKMGYSKSAVATAIDILISNDSDSELPQNRSTSFSSTQNVKEGTECDTENDNGDTQTILRMNKSLKSMVTCIKCKHQARNMLFLPCTHHCLCHICAAKCSLCPMCYRIIKQKIKTFMI